MAKHRRLPAGRATATRSGGLKGWKLGYTHDRVPRSSRLDVLSGTFDVRNLWTRTDTETWRMVRTDARNVSSNRQPPNRCAYTEVPHISSTHTTETERMQYYVVIAVCMRCTVDVQSMLSPDPISQRSPTGFNVGAYMFTLASIPSSIFEGRPI